MGYTIVKNGNQYSILENGKYGYNTTYTSNRNMNLLGTDIKKGDLFKIIKNDNGSKKALLIRSNKPKEGTNNELGIKYLDSFKRNTNNVPEHIAGPEALLQYMLKKKAGVTYEDRTGKLYNSEGKQVQIYKPNPDTSKAVEDTWMLENPQHKGYNEKSGLYFPYYVGNTKNGPEYDIGPGINLHNQSTEFLKLARLGMTKNQIDQYILELKNKDLQEVDKQLSHYTTMPDTISPLIKLGLADIQYLTGNVKSFKNALQAAAWGLLKRLQLEAEVKIKMGSEYRKDYRRNELRNSEYFNYNTDYNYHPYNVPYNKNPQITLVSKPKKKYYPRTYNFFKTVAVNDHAQMSLKPKGRYLTGATYKNDTNKPLYIYGNMIPIGSTFTVTPSKSGGFLVNQYDSEYTGIENDTIKKIPKKRRYFKRHKRNKIHRTSRTFNTSKIKKFNIL